MKVRGDAIFYGLEGKPRHRLSGSNEKRHAEAEARKLNALRESGAIGSITYLRRYRELYLTHASHKYCSLRQREAKKAI